MEQVIITIFGLILGCLAFWGASFLKTGDREVDKMLKGSLIAFGGFLCMFCYILEAWIPSCNKEVGDIVYTSVVVFCAFYATWDITSQCAEETKKQRIQRLCTRWVLAVILLGVIFCASIR